MKLAKRAATYTQFSKAKSACLFATDVAARGLDFPSVDWVVQYDCADSMATYIHRVGRTARYTSSGKAVILLLPSETKFVERLQEAQIPIKKMRIKETKLVNITPKIASIVAENMDVKHLAQRALISYVKAVHLFADKEVFNAKTLKAKDLAVSFGLATAPTLKFKDSESRVAPGVHTMGLNIKNVEKRKSQNEFGYRPQERKDDLFNSVRLSVRKFLRSYFPAHPCRSRLDKSNADVWIYTRYLFLYEYRARVLATMTIAMSTAVTC